MLQEHNTRKQNATIVDCSGRKRGAIAVVLRYAECATNFTDA